MAGWFKENQEPTTPKPNIKIVAQNPTPQINIPIDINKDKKDDKNPDNTR